jgi:amino acid adenylation domain-containing protein
VEDVVGLFVNTLVMRADLGGDPPFREVLRRVREAALGAYEHQEVPFERLVEALRPERSLSHSPLFQVMFSLDHAGDRPLDLAGVRVARVAADTSSTQFDLTLGLTARGDSLRAAVEYSTDLFERATVERMVARLARVLEQVTADPGVRLSALELLDDAERRLLVDEWGRDDAEPPARCLHALVAERAARTPEAVAVEMEGRALTYAELDARADRLARHLAALGVGPEVRVGVCLERAPELIVALLAAWKAGGAYVPLDPGYPAERLAWMLSDSGAAVLLVDARTAAAVQPPDGVRVVRVDGDVPDSDARLPAADPASLAYVIYTSGSTGRPKGVAVEHRSIAAYVVHAARSYALGPGDRVLQFHSISFDPAAEEIFGALVSGATLVLRTDDTLAGPDAFWDACRRERITLIDLPTAIWHPLASALDARPALLPDGLRVAVIGGERVQAEPLRAWRRAAAGRVRLLNSYGPTETAVGASVWEAPPNATDDAGVVPIGRPVPGGRCYVLDASGRPAPLGVPGELCVGGVQVARGYLGRPALTAERFVPDPFPSVPGARLYRTGDRARWVEGGVLEYLGRLDEQVKVSGIRIEPGEIEAALLAQPGVRECAAVVRETAGGEKRLVAYVVADGAAGGDGLRAALRGALPQHLVPSAIVHLDRLPLTPNGKLDRRALPEPEAAPAAPAVAPRTELEARVAEVWRSVLERPDVGVHENFFDLGGTSLLLYRVFSRVRELRRDLRVVDLFRYPTVESLAGYLGAEPHADDAAFLLHARSRADERRAALRRRVTGEAR